MIASTDTKPALQRTVELHKLKTEIDEHEFINWHEDVELKKQWEEVKKVEEKLIQVSGSRKPCRRYRSNCILVKDTEEMVGWRNLKQEEVDECWRKIAVEIKRRSYTSTRWKTAKERPTEGEGHPWSGEMFEEARNIGLENGVKIAGQDSSRGSENISCNESKACRKVPRRRKR